MLTGQKREWESSITDYSCKTQEVAVRPSIQTSQTKQVKPLRHMSQISQAPLPHPKFCSRTLRYRITAPSRLHQSHSEAGHCKHIRCRLTELACNPSPETFIIFRCCSIAHKNNPSTILWFVSPL